MCGIAGIVSERDELRARVGAMAATLAHRGPDDAGVEHYTGASLGHQRLSIIDLDGGHQPLSNARRTVHIVFNGEIYNFPELREELVREGVAFRTRTDTEVILALYERDGERCVDRLRGMFAFGIWDEPRQRLFLARDRMGQKPLFYRTLPGGGLAFASEVKGILAGGLAANELDMQALYHYISLRYIPDELTLFKGIAKLPAAHTLTLEHGTVRRRRYWSVSYLDKLPDDEEDVRRELDRRLRESVKIHALADVPVGTFLSGGIDSSLITGMLADQSERPVDTFSLGVREHEFNELPFAREVASRWHTAHREAVVSADLVHLVPQMIWHMDEPSDPFGVGVYLVSRLAARDVKVVLTGDGGDELFAGYDRFAGNRLVDLYAVLPAALRRTVIRSLANRVPDSFGYKSLAQKVRWVNEMSLLQGGERYALSMSFLRFTEDAKRSLFRPAALSDLPEQESVGKILAHYNASCVEDAVDRMLYTDGMTRLPDHLLMIVDRMAMAHGLEARPPLLDHEIVEFAARIPARLKLNGHRLKYVLRQTASAYLPRDIITRKKQGFGFPIARWMRTELRPLLEHVFRDSRFVEAGIFERGYMDRLLTEHLSGRSDHNFRLWILLNLEVWHRLYLEQQSPEQLAEWMHSYTAPGVAAA
jgi:asparagine synthase (glutamine-hydrolysing)